MSRRVISVLCTVLASVLLLVGVVAGVVNRQVLDGTQFARHIDAVRRDPAVSRQIGQAITTQTLAAAPDLVAFRPLVEASATALAASPAFSPVVRASARQLHASFTEGGRSRVVWRLVDVGAVVSGVLPVLSPQAAARVPPGLAVTLANAGPGSIVARTVHLTRVVGLLAWLLPLLALLGFGAGLWFAPARFQTTARAGWAIMGAGLGVGAVALTGELVASAADQSTLHGALVAASWRQFGRPLWWAAAITAGAGGLLAAAASGPLPQFNLAVGTQRVWTVVTRTPDRRWPRFARGAALVAIGLGALLRPAMVFGVLAGLIGLVLLVAGVGELAAATVGAQHAGRVARRARAGPRRRWVPLAASGAAVALVAGLVAFDSAPTTDQVGTLVAAGRACNGYVQLCNRPYNDVSFVATHNAMSAADEPGWFIPEQPTGLVGQLNAGVRVLLVDTWYGQTTTTSGLIATAPGSHAAALAESERLFGPAVVSSVLRLRDAVAPTPVGPVVPYLCHGLCEIGATELEPEMAAVRAWLDNNPRQVVTLFFEDDITPADTAKALRQAGLQPDLYTPEAGQPWPTLGQMINSGHRVVVLMENHGGGTTYPWLEQGFDVVQDTPYSNPTEESLSCALNRGSASHPLFLVNYWLSNNFLSLVSDARTINAYGVIWPYLQRCEAERDRLPNFVAVNFFDLGDVFRAVRQLNGLR